MGVKALTDFTLASKVFVSFVSFTIPLNDVPFGITQLLGTTVMPHGFDPKYNFGLGRSLSAATAPPSIPDQLGAVGRITIIDGTRFVAQ